jgi:hypothetical protein
MIIFAEAPWIGNNMPRPRWMDATLILGATVASLAMAATGISSHSSAPDWVPRAAGIDAVIRQLKDHIAQQPPGVYVISYVHSGSIDASVVQSQLIFEMHVPHGIDGSVTLGASLIRTFNGPDNALTKVQWNALPGADDAAKIEGEVGAILQHCDMSSCQHPRASCSSPPISIPTPEFRRQLLLQTADATGLLLPSADGIGRSDRITRSGFGARPASRHDNLFFH